MPPCKPSEYRATESGELAELGRLGQEHVDKDTQCPQARRHGASAPRWAGAWGPTPTTPSARCPVGARSLSHPTDLVALQQTSTFRVLSEFHFRPCAQMRNYLSGREGAEPGAMIERPARGKPVQKSRGEQVARAGRINQLRYR